MKLDRNEIGQNLAAGFENFDDPVEGANPGRFEKRRDFVDRLMVAGIDP